MTLRGHAKSTFKVALPRTWDWLRDHKESRRAAARRRHTERRPRNDFGGLRRLLPVSDSFGTDRGTPIDRYYIGSFLAAHSPDIRGRVLEIGDDRYMRRYGGDRVTRADVLHYVAGNPKATIIADLSRAGEIPANSFDCIIVTQTLQMIYEIRDAIGHLHRILHPGGILLVTSHGTSKIGRAVGVSPWGEYWRITAQSARLLFEERFAPGNVDVTTYGNVLTAMGFLHGLAAEELEPDELAFHDPRFEVLVAVRAVK